MKRLFQYLREVKEEFVNKVTWPKWSELQKSAIIVMVASIIISLLIFILDVSFYELLKLFYSIFF